MAGIVFDYRYPRGYKPVPGPAVLPSSLIAQPWMIDPKGVCGYGVQSSRKGLERDRHFPDIRLCRFCSGVSVPQSGLSPLPYKIGASANPLRYRQSGGLGRALGPVLSPWIPTPAQDPIRPCGRQSVRPALRSLKQVALTAA